VAILFDPTQEYTKTAAATVKTQLEAANVTVTSYAEVQPGKDQATYTSAVTAANADTPDAIYAAVYYPEGAKIAQAVTDLGTGQNALPCLLDYSSYDTGYVQDAGATAAQACNVVGVPAPSDFANSDPYVAAYTAEFNSSPGTWSPYTYDSVRILVDTVASVGTWDTAALTSGLTSISNWNGWTGSVSIEAATGNRVPATVVVTQVNYRWGSSIGTPGRRSPKWAPHEVVRDPTTITVHGTFAPSTSAVHLDGRGIPSARLSLKPKDTELP